MEGYADGRTTMYFYKIDTSTGIEASAGVDKYFFFFLRKVNFMCTNVNVPELICICTTKLSLRSP